MRYTDYDGASRNSEDTMCHSGLDQGELGYVTCEGDNSHKGKHWGVAPWHGDDGQVVIIMWTGGHVIAGDTVPAGNVEHHPADELELAVLKRHAEEREAQYMDAENYEQAEPPAPYRLIEPSQGLTYHHDGEYSVYEYGTYEASSVLAGQEKRSLIEGGFTSPEAARAAHPEATVSEFTQCRPVVIPATPPSWFDPANAGESWDGE